MAVKLEGNLQVLTKTKGNKVVVTRKRIVRIEETRGRRERERGNTNTFS